MDNYLKSGSWFNRSPRVLWVTAVLTALGFIAFLVATEFFVAQYFVCIGECRPGGAPLLLIVVSSFFALIPVAGMGVIGYWIVKGLWEDAQQVAAEEQAAAEGRELLALDAAPEVLTRLADDHDVRGGVRGAAGERAVGAEDAPRSPIRPNGVVDVVKQVAVGSEAG
ncbi:MAG: hypothetical protein QOK05_1438 [Chloroflexota bacterium]|nr:hypothetical protein [Chloroflexota bacterium]